MSKRARLHSKANSKTKSNISPLAKVQGLTLFGSPQLLLHGENAAAYDELLGRVCAAIKPVDIIDEMFIADVVPLEWDVLRWRRLKSSLIQTHAFNALKEFLCKDLEYDHYRKFFEQALAEILQDNPEEQSEDDVQMLAHKCAQNERDAVAKVNQILGGIDLDMDNILYRGKARKANETSCTCRRSASLSTARRRSISRSMALRRVSATVVRRSIRLISSSSLGNA